MTVSEGSVAGPTGCRRWAVRHGRPTWRDRVVRGLLIGVVALAAGAAVTVSPLSLGLIGGGIIRVWLVAIGRRSIAVFHGVLVALLAG